MADSGIEVTLHLVLEKFMIVSQKLHFLSLATDQFSDYPPQTAVESIVPGFIVDCGTGVKIIQLE